MRTLTRENLLDILYGCTILGTGGGGSLEKGIAMIDEALAAGKTFQLASFEEMGPEDIIGTPYACGAISPLTEEEVRKYARLKETEESFYILCMKQLEQFLGREVSAVISTELGGGNTATAFYVGAMTGRPIMDGDPAGRSVPALQQNMFMARVTISTLPVLSPFPKRVPSTRSAPASTPNSASLMPHPRSLCGWTLKTTASLYFRFLWIYSTWQANTCGMAI